MVVIVSKYWLHSHWRRGEAFRSTTGSKRNFRVAPFFQMSGKPAFVRVQGYAERGVSVRYTTCKSQSWCDDDDPDHHHDSDLYFHPSVNFFSFLNLLDTYIQISWSFVSRMARNFSQRSVSPTFARFMRKPKKATRSLPTLSRFQRKRRMWTRTRSANGRMRSTT